MKPIRNLPRSPLTAAQRTEQKLRSNASNRFCVSFSRNTPGINTEQVLDKDKTHALQRASI